MKRKETKEAIARIAARAQERDMKDRAQKAARPDSGQALESVEAAFGNLALGELDVTKAQLPDLCDQLFAMMEEDRLLKKEQDAREGREVFATEAAPATYAHAAPVTYAHAAPVKYAAAPTQVVTQMPSYVTAPVMQQQMVTQAPSYVAAPVVQQQVVTQAPSYVAPPVMQQDQSGKRSRLELLQELVMVKMELGECKSTLARVEAENRQLKRRKL